MQAARWSRIADGGGYIYSFNGPHSLFVDTIRSLRALAVGHQLGHALMGENDRKISLLDALSQHAAATAQYSVFYGEGRDVYDVRGRVAHESIFNPNDGNYRCPNTQQGYSPFSTWTRGLAWAMLRIRRAARISRDIPDERTGGHRRAATVKVVVLQQGGGSSLRFLHRARHGADGIPYWDTGAPAWTSSAIGESRRRSVQRLRTGRQFGRGNCGAGICCGSGGICKNDRYWQAGLTVG